MFYLDWPRFEPMMVLLSCLDVLCSYSIGRCYGYCCCCCWYCSHALLSVDCIYLCSISQSTVPRVYFDAHKCQCACTHTILNLNLVDALFMHSAYQIDWRPLCEIHHTNEKGFCPRKWTRFTHTEQLFMRFCTQTTNKRTNAFKLFR